ncbi:hypothetical protein PTB20_004110 [Vibrio alginolyticus]|nr:hypothetical protein [Vibrio alginolyticus]
MTNFLARIAAGLAIYKKADEVPEEKVQSLTDLFKSIGSCLKWLAIWQFVFSVADIADSITLMSNTIMIVIQYFFGNAA